MGLTLKNIVDQIKFPSKIEDKIFEIRFEKNNSHVSKITSYFPLSGEEKKEITDIIGDDYFNRFYSIFTDHVSEEEWNKTKEQIKTKFKKELFDIDNLS